MNLLSTTQSKTCSSCKECKDISEFSKRKESKDGLRGECRKCATKYSKAYRARNPEKHKEMIARSSARNAERRKRTAQSWATKNPERLLNNQLKNTYGITLDDYNQRLLNQGGVCKICNSPPDAKKRLYVDHCHNSSKVRGLLCKACNNGIGFLKDSAELCLSAYKYLNETE